MSRELNKIFDVQSREARREILDKFDLSADDKNKVLNKIGNCSGGNNENEGGSLISYYKFTDMAYWENIHYEIFENVLIPFGALTATYPDDILCINYAGDGVNSSIQFLTPLGIAGLNVPIIWKNIGVVDNKDWIKNLVTLNKNNYDNIEEILNSMLIPITKEEFYNLKYSYE